MRSFLSLGLLCAAVTTAVAQDTALIVAVAAAQPATYTFPECGIEGGHYRVNSAATYLKTAIENEANRERLLEDGTRSAIDAILENNQGENPAAWYYLGRLALYQGDVTGADTAFARAVTLAPECGAEIRRYRATSAQALLMAGSTVMQTDPVRARQAFKLATVIAPGEPRTWYVAAGMEEAAGNMDTALVLYKNAWLVNPDSAGQYGNLAVARVADLYEASGSVDSAVAWYSTMAGAGGDNADMRARARMSMGRILYNAKRYPDAIVVFRQQIGEQPADADAKQFLALAYEANNQLDSAQAIRATLGVAPGAGARDTTSASFLINRGAESYRAGDKARAAADFALALEREPGNRIAARNLLSVYNELENGEGLVVTSTRVLVLEPLSETFRRYQVQGYLYLEDQEGAGRAVDAMDAMPVSVEDVKLVPGGGGATLTAVVTGREVAGQSPRPVNLIVEFLDAGGGVVAAESVTIPALSAGGIHQLSVNATGGGIVAFRYREN